MKDLIPTKRNFLKPILFSLMSIITVSYKSKNYLSRYKEKKFIGY